jgi:cyclopropane fatty-acyl-phospholipid synthase-like methyltransferase
MGPAERSDDDASAALPAPVVPPDVYDESYYKHCCAGFEEWTSSGGERFAGIYPGVLTLAKFRPGMVLVDVGTGRGEMLAVAVEMGAARAVGIEYAPTAVEMAEQTLKVHGTGDRAEVRLADARRIPLEDGIADLVTLVDVVEHLSREELDRSLLEIRRILKPGGRVFIHTMPNRTIYDVTYPLLRALVPGGRKRWPADPRVHDEEREMHINEQTLTSLRGYLRRAGFHPMRVWLGSWVYTEFIPGIRARKIMRFLAAMPPTRRLAIGDLFAEGTKR